MPPVKRTNLKLTDEVQDRIVMALKAGNFAEAAAGFAGIARPTYYRWLKEGDAALLKHEAGGKLNDNETRYMNFLLAVQEAKAQAVVRNVSIITQAAQGGQWQAAAWWLERTHPQQFARRNVTEVVGANDGPVNVNVTSDDLEDLVAKVLGASDGDR